MSRRKQQKPRHLEGNEGTDKLLSNEMNETLPSHERSLSSPSKESSVCNKCNTEFPDITELMEHKKLCFPEGMLNMCNTRQQEEPVEHAIEENQIETDKNIDNDFKVREKLSPVGSMPELTGEMMPELSSSETPHSEMSNSENVPELLRSETTRLVPELSRAEPRLLPEISRSEPRLLPEISRSETTRVVPELSHAEPRLLPEISRSESTRVVSELSRAEPRLFPEISRSESTRVVPELSHAEPRLLPEISRSETTRVVPELSHAEPRMLPEISRCESRPDDGDLMESDEDDYDEDEEDEDGADDARDAAAMLQYQNAMLAQLIPNHNVKLEHLESTRVAVAQFAENNNMPPADFAMLQNALITLHQQQLIQFHMLQQIQHHLMASAGANGLGKLPQLIPPMLPNPAALTVPPPASQENKQKNTPQEESNKENQTPEEVAVKPTEATPVSVPLMRSEAPPTSLVTPSPQPFTSSVNSGSSLFRKTPPGERPYKCNVCGNRFSTKGNLKVHFQRHREQYPHIRMNGEPLPEHLEKSTSEHGNMADQPASHAPERPIIPEHLGKTEHQPPPLIPGPPQVSLAPSIAHHHEQMKLEEMEDVEEWDDRDERDPEMDEISPTPTDLSDMGVQKSPASSESSGGCKPLIPHTLSSPAIVSSSMMNPLAAMSNMMANTTPMPLPSGFPGMPPFSSPFGMEPPPFLRGSILPSKNDDPMEQYMEVDKSSETRKLEALVKNIESKLSDPNECAMCHRILSCKSALQMHYRTHTGERPFKCKICGRAFTTKGNLKTHMGVHRAKPPLRMMHQCPVCHKQFTNALVLQQHIRMHTNDIPHELKIQNEMMAAAAMGFMRPPFPGLPFQPGMPMPHGIPPMQTGELDLRKPENKEVNHEKTPEQDHHREEKEARELDTERPTQTWGNDHDMDEMNDDFDDDENMRDDMNMDQKEGRESPRSISPKEHEVSSDDDSKSHPTPLGHASDATSKYLHQLSNYMSQAPPSNSSTSPQYSTSLMALEERVKAIEHMATAPSFHQQLYGNPYLQQPKSQSAHDASGISRVSTPSGGSISGGSADERGTPGSKSGTPIQPSISPAGSTEMDDPMDEYGSRPFEAMGGRMQPTSCNVCYKTFACRSALDIHYRSHTKERPYRCDVCDRGFSTKGNMKQHMLTHKIRDLPNEAFNSDGSQSLPSSMPSPMPTSMPPSMPSPMPSSMPIKSEGGIMPPAISSSPESVSVTSSPPLPAVPTTPKMSTSPTDPRTSPFIKQPSLKHMCQVCSKPFSSASALQIHIRTHTGDKPFKCTVCQKAFTTKGNLKVHMGTHMWNNSPSRRGRRMSVDLAALAGQNKDADYFRHYAHRPEMYPYPPMHHFANGFGAKMNEIPVIQSLNGGIGRLPPSSMAEVLGAQYLPPATPEKKRVDSPATKSESYTIPKSPLVSFPVPPSYPISDSSYNNNNNDKVRTAANGELDLSMKKSTTPPSEPTKQAPPPHPAWAWMQNQETATSKPLMA